MSHYDSATYNRRPGPMYNTDRIQLVSAPTTPVLFYSNVTGTGSVFIDLTVCNYTGAMGVPSTDSNFFVFIVPAAVSPSPPYAVYFNTSLKATETYGQPMRFTLHPNDSVYVASGAANTISFWANIEVEI